MDMKRIFIMMLCTTLMLMGCKPESSQKYIVQICTGGWNNQNYSTGEIIARLDTVTSMVPVEKVIIGWNLDPQPYRQIGEYLHSKGIKMLLWLPVFSEIGHIEPTEQSVDIWGEMTESFNLQEGEDFTFYCPSSPVNIAAVKTVYQQYFSDCGFDGVFLDKIRTASYVAGESGVLSCGCERCMEIYAQKGVDIDALKDTMCKDDNVFRTFLKAKADIVAESVGDIAQWFHGMGLEVGLDLFAPEIADIVGQDYVELSKHADFVKPMMYRKTDAPAGIGFEKRFSDPDFSDEAMDYAYLLNELEKAAEMASCPVYPGIEVNYREDIARTTPEYVRESMKAVRAAGLPGAVLAWDVMLAPDSHLEAVVK